MIPVNLKQGLQKKVIVFDIKPVLIKHLRYKTGFVKLVYQTVNGRRALHISKSKRLQSSVAFILFENYTMWMAYVNEIEIKDLRSGVQFLIQKFSNLSFDARHEAIYGMGTIMSSEKCEKLADNYDKGEEFCQKYLDGKIDIIELCNELEDLELERFLYRLKNFLPAWISSLYFPDSDNKEN